MESVKALKTPKISDLHARAWPGMEIPVILCAENSVLEIFYQFLSKQGNLSNNPLNSQRHRNN
jgi:hypothetical protein